MQRLPHPTQPPFHGTVPVSYTHLDVYKRQVLPCVRLIQPSAPSCEPCFQAEVEILAEIYMIRWEPCMVGVPKPVCPDLPLYPQPCIPG